MPFVDMTGKRFGRYTVIKRVENDKHGNAVWLCRCDCGNEKNVVGRSLRSGVVVSCGCYHKDDIRVRETTHNESKTRLFHIWQKMKSRCYNAKNKFYSYYGGRGISVCDEWKDDYSAFSAWSKSNGYDDTLTIDRIDHDGNYCPQNCRWVSRKVQQNNTRYTHLFTINGETHSIAEWCRIYNVPHERVRQRVVNKGWDILDALTVPPKR